MNKEEKDFYIVLSNVTIAITQFTAVGLVLFYYLSDPRFNILTHTLILIEIVYILIIVFVYVKIRRRFEYV